MGKITKTLQPKHKESNTPWLQEFVQRASTTQLPDLPAVLHSFPTRWPFPRGDLYHWIPLLNKFDTVLESFVAIYKLSDGTQTRDFGSDVILQLDPQDAAPSDTKPFDATYLRNQGYGENADAVLVRAVLQFTEMLLHHCGNRSIYASSSHLNDLLNSTDLDIVCATLRVGVELAKRYQASVKRLRNSSFSVTSALLLNHYNIDLYKVHQLAQPFVKTPIIKPAVEPHSLSTPTASSKGKPPTSKAVNSMYANDLCAIAKETPSDESRWQGWGDVRVPYYPVSSAPEPQEPQPVQQRIELSSTPSTPTPLRRSNSANVVQTTPRSARQSMPDDTPLPGLRSPAFGGTESAGSAQKSVDLPHSAVVTSPIYKLLDRAPSDLPKESRYDFLNRVRVAKALTGNVSSREQALKARLLAIENLAYIHQESAFVDKALKQDSDEPRRFQLIYQLAELIRPSSDGSSSVSRDVQAIALSLLDVLTTNIHSKIPDIFSALNATVNHGVLLYVIRKAVAEMKEDDAGEGYTVEDEWRDNLFSLTHHVTLAMANTSRNTPEIISAGLFDIMVEILAIRSNVAERMYSTLLANLDSLISYVQSPSFSIISAEGLDAITDLITHEVDLARKLVADGKGTPRSWRSQIVDYDVPFWQQQNLKFLLKFIHHLMTNAFAFGGNTDRLLRNLVDKSTLLQSLREIITNGDVFGSLVWTSTANSLSDFLNNDPTSFAAISEAGLVQCFLESITGRPVTVEESAGPGDSNSQDTPSSLIAVDDRPHPPTQEMLQTPRTGTLAGGIRATSEAITAVPTVLNAISLNNQGIKMVASSRAFESYFEIFESPEHVRIMSANDPELAANVGNHFDELARHHPALRPAITNAVVDMVARIVYLSNQKASASGLGAKLVTHDVSASSPADTDANGIEWDSEGSHLRFGPEMSPPQQSALPYIYATASFLQQYVGNQQLRQSLVQKGLIEYLLDLCTSPSLPHRFGESGAARSLHQVIAQLVETSPVLGIPSLVRRIRKSLEALEPLTTSSTSESFFVRYLAADPAKTDSAVSLSTGNVVVKELLNVQSLVKALANCFPISNRSANLMYPTVNAYDYYHELITALGPLLRSVVTQEELAMRCVPWSWIQPKKQQESTDGATGTGDGSSNSAGDDEAALSSMLSPNQYRMAWDRLRPSTKTEYSSSRYRNFDTINAVLHSSMSAIFPLLQTFGKALLSRSRNDRTSSDRDNYIRAHHVKLAHELGGILYDQLTIPENPRTPAQFHYWIIMTHATHEVLFDRRYDPRAERNGHQASASVLVAFMQKGGFKQLNSILEIFASEINDPNTGEDSPLRKLATIGVKKILKLYAIVANGKTIAEAVGHTAFLGRSSSRSLENQIAPNLVVELRMTLLPVIQDLWKSPLIENEAKDSEEIANKVIDILKSISGVDGTEHGAYGRSEKNTPPLLLKQEEVKFPWTTVVESISRVRGEGYDGQLASEAVFRANGDAIRAIDYCKAHKAGIAGARNPIPEVDVMNTDPDEIESTSTPTGEPQPATSASDDQPMIDADLPADLPAGILDNEILGDLRDVAPLVPGMEWTEGNATSSTAQDAAPISADSETRSQTGVPREELDEARVKLREDLIDRCLDVIRAHPSSTYEISELINNSVIRSSTDDSAKQEIGETLVNALISFVADEDLKPNGRSISAYAHLLSLLLQNRGFFTATMGSLRDNVTEFLGFLRPASPATEEIDPWIPYILLIFEILLSDDEQPSDIKWKAPTSEDDVIEPLQWAPKDLIVNESDRQALLTSILDILPRVNKAESLAVSVLRILVILTRNKSTAQVVGDKKNLSRIFVMMKQLSSSGSNRLGDTRISSYVLTILRHIIEDEDIIKQLMRSEIRSYFDNVRSQRNPDIGTYLRQNSHVALRDPHLFVDVSNEMVCISRWNAGDSTSQRQTVALKAQKPETPKDDVAPTVRATEDLSIQDVKPSTESTVKPTTDAIKSVLQDIKRPILENPDGVIHFLLCELLNYREVEDKEPVQPAADSKDIKDTASPNPNSVNDSSDNKDKKKPSFKAEEHPIFIYRCLILRCLIELLQSYNQTKVEFINFKRSAPMQTNTPIKPRSSVLNYLLTDLLCATPLDGSSDTLADKKKAATSIQAQNLLVALMAKTSEKPVDRTREKFDYDEETDLLFVRKFVLDTILKAYKDASSSNEAFDIRYGRMLALADVMHQIMGADKDGKVLPSSRHHPEPMPERSHAQIRRLMYEKGYLNTLTSSIADIDLAFPPVKKTIKQILKVLRVLTSTATHLSNANILPDSSTTQEVEDDIASATSLSDLEDDREETPDLYRNSALGMLEPGRDPDDDYESGSGEDDEEMYDDEYGEEMEYDEDVSLDGENDVSDEDEDVEGMEGMEGMGHIEGLPGELGVVEVTMEDDDDEDDDEMDEDDEDMSEDDEELGSDEMDEMGDQIEIVDDEGNPVEDDGASGWESDTDDEGEVDEDDEHDLHDYEAAAQEMIEQGHQHELGAFGGLIPALDEEDDYDGGDDVNIHPYPEEDEDDDDDDDEDEDDMDEDDYAFEPYLDDGPPPHILSSSMGWDVFEDGLGGGHNHRHRHGFRGPFPPIPLMMGGPRDPLLAAMRNTFMRPGRNDRSGTNDDGLNPLLRRVNEPGRDGPSRPHGSLARILRGHGGSPLALINELITNQLPALGGGGPPLQFHISAAGSNGEIQEITVPITHSRDPIAETRHGNQDPSQASTFSTENTISRWHEEAKMVFGQNHAEKIVKLLPALLYYLVPPAIQRDKEQKAKDAEIKRKQEEERKKREEEDRQAREAKEAEDKAAREKVEAEERERAEAEAAARAAANPTSAEGAKHDDDVDAMEGVESNDQPTTPSQQTADQPRVTTIIRGEEVDVTDLGIDADYLEALPEEFREEVIAQAVTQRRSQARETPRRAGEQPEVFQEFLDALPEDIRQEIVQQERAEQRRRDREEARRQQAAAAGQGPVAQEMDTASILMSFPPDLREQVLLDQGPDLMDSLPPEMAAEARRLVRHNPAVVHRHRDGVGSGQAAASGQPSGSVNLNIRPERKTVVQMLDKSGVATLLRLMFINIKSGTMENPLKHVIKDICQNKQTRLDVVSTLLQILQDGTTDLEAVERSFTQLSIKAKQSSKDKEGKTPQSHLKRSLTNTTTNANPTITNSETSPVLIIQQCLDLLCFLADEDVHIPALFLTEHDTVASSLKRSLSRKGKGKVPDLKSHKYAINSLLALLDRDLVIESSTIMDSLSQLLGRVTLPLLGLDRKLKEADETIKKLDKEIEEGEAVVAKAAKSEVGSETSQPATLEQTDIGAETTTATLGATTDAHATAEPITPGKAAESVAKAKEKRDALQKRIKTYVPPQIPVHNLKLVINIFVARECSSKTFKETLSAIKNLSVIPDAMDVFGEELARQSRLLSEKIVVHLDELLPHIEKASTGTEIQGVALAKFSPGAADQNKLLRILTALDHLFSSKKSDFTSGSGPSNETKFDLLATLYRSPTFHALWERLSSCLSAIRQRESLISVATILLPLIETLMVVCKDTANPEPVATQQVSIASPAPESPMTNLFLNFTEEHRRILNELVRNNPSLMKGTFQNLVKNPKVLEFDNKRNWFNRSVHNRNQIRDGRTFPSLQLSVRRDQVFHDSFRSLYFKSGDEMKFGKLNIRFHGEEGVDAGGVTREWFQVLSRQMFDANYALFVPVSSDRTTFHPNKLSGINDEHLMFFKFIGRVIGKALYEGRVLDCYFSRAVYKRILGKTVSVKDMESFDPDYYKSLVWMLENDITDIITEMFSVETDEFGVTRTEDLCENGRNIPVTEDNKQDYVRLVVEHKLLSSVKEQMEHFLKGFHEIIPAELVSIFTEQELELLISGLPDIDVDDWKSNTEYQNYTPSSQQIQWFWRAIRSFDKEELAKLLQFVTGTSKVPLNGFKELEGMNGVNRFNIHRDYGNKDRLPSSHTCFNQLDLPEYESYETLRAQVLKAITAGSDYFGFA
ncbi:hypothetical protein BKA67DRAFT_511823 [Truncatella angustata]|uniref:HECT-type E3 ubiquitin transferase n=1 Tax=Truncatella angustata TaxID=152316 RepID=A0A9P8URE9_9PEZI|nr:uncharacterized protein BKA67DRAFT_511823 [Truncatella angustata]KAH6656670.1 hypothetical protein BKA67DRAFT_511823 [Truncatella angustata]